MSDFIEKSVHAYEGLKDIYKNHVYHTLETPMKQLELALYKLLDDKSGQYYLESNNSVYKAKYYHIKTRIKKDVSFYEKLIRKNIGLLLVQKFDLVNNPEALSIKIQEIRSEIEKNDDLIGLRIVTELKQDCKNVYNLVLNSGDFFQEMNIKFHDLEGQPQKMKNGLDIFRIKGTFNAIYQFELQIKSKIDEAWGDMDHSLFYKDYSISPIKDTVQVTMNNVGELLDRIERLLYDLRESGMYYAENAEHLKFQKSIEKEIGPLIKNRLNIPYNLKSISLYLKFFKEITGAKGKKLEALDFSYLEWTSDDEFLKPYIDLRKENYALIFLETIYWSWKKLDNTFNLEPNNYNQYLHQYLDYFIEFISLSINKDKVILTPIIKTLIVYSKSADVFLSTTKFEEIEEICNRVGDIAIENEIDDQIAYIQQCFRIALFNGDIN